MKSVNSAQSNRWRRVLTMGAVTLLSVGALIPLMAILSSPSTSASDDQAVPIFSFAQDRLLSSGGLDVFGYTFKDSNEVDIPSFPESVDNPSVVNTTASWPQARVKAALHSSPVMFIENVGQFDAGARFQVRGGMGTMWLAEDAIWVTVLEPADKGIVPLSHSHFVSPVPQRGVNLKLSFPGANPHPRIEPFDRLDTVVSYFIGNDPTKWRPAVPVWGGVRYVDLYPGMDLEVTSEEGRWAWRLVAREQTPSPAPSPSQVEGWGGGVRLRVEGADSVAILPSPDPSAPLRAGVGRGAGGEGLHLTTAVGEFTLPLLTVEGLHVERVNVERVNVRVFDVTPPFSSAPSLPSPSAQTADASDLLYATFLGGSNLENGLAIAVDGAGSAYVTGGTVSSDFPTTPGAFDTSHNGDVDAFVVKLNANGTGLAYATFLGGSGDDYGGAIAVDGAGSAYVTGRARSSDFPTTPGAFDTSYNGDADAFVVKLNAGGTGLAYATFLGGGSYDLGSAIAVDGAGSAYVAGYTGSSDFPTTPGAFDTSYNDGDAFVVKLNAVGTGLTYATFLGGSSDDGGSAIAVDGAGSVYVTGSTGSSDFPTTPGAFNTSHNGLGDAFVVKVNAEGTGLAYATFLGGSGSDYGYAIAVDGAGSAYVMGHTYSSDFPTTPGAFDTSYNDGDAFVVKLNAGGTGLAYATFLGGSSGDRGRAIAVDGAGSAYVTGDTYSSDFPTTPWAFDTSHNGNQDAFVVKVNAGGTGLAYATFLGGSAYDGGIGVLGSSAIAVDGAGSAYVTGGTSSSDFPTTSWAFDTSHNGGEDAFVAKLTVISRKLFLPLILKNSG